jgi:hypothetical protein
MKTTPKLTPWFTNGEKPVHVGVYNVSCRREKQSGIWYAYWDGERFHFFESSVKCAYEMEVCESRDHVLTKGSWRGLAEKSEV